MYCVKSPCKQYLPTFNFLDFKLLFEHWTLAPVRFRQTKRRSHSRRPSFVCSLFYLISIFLLFFFCFFLFLCHSKTVFLISFLRFFQNAVNLRTALISLPKRKEPKWRPSHFLKPYATDFQAFRRSGKTSFINYVMIRV